MTGLRAALRFDTQTYKEMTDDKQKRVILIMLIAMLLIGSTVHFWEVAMRMTNFEGYFAYTQSALLAFSMDLMLAVAIWSRNKQSLNVSFVLSVIWGISYYIPEINGFQTWYVVGVLTPICFYYSAKTILSEVLKPSTEPVPWTIETNEIDWDELGDKLSLSRVTIDWILKLKAEEGLSYRQIQDKTGVNKNKVGKILKAA